MISLFSIIKKHPITTTVALFVAILIISTLVVAFHCSFPGCRRSFNVNSNMQRHYWNHSMIGRFVSVYLKKAHSCSSLPLLQQPPIILQSLS